MFSAEYFRHYRKNFHLAYPIVIGQLSGILIMISDNLMVGNYESESLAASSLANGIVTTVMLTGVSFTYGLTPLVAVADAEGNQAKAARFFHHALLLFPLMGLILSSIALFFSSHLSLFNAHSEITERALPYMQIISFSLFPVMIFQAFKQFLEGLEHTKEPMFVNLFGAGANFLLNYLLIYGKAGFPEMGLYGAGIATLVVRILMCVLMIAVFLAQKKFRAALYTFADEKFSRMPFAGLFKIGTPAGLQMLFEAGAFAFSTVLIGRFGHEVLAAHQIAMNIGSVTFLVAAGLSAAAAIRTANSLGRKDRPNLLASGKSAVYMSAGFMAVCALLIFLGRDFLPGLYVREPEVIEIAAGLLIIVAAFQVCDGIQVVSIGALRGIGDVKIPSFIAMMAYWAVGIPLAYVLGFPLGMGPKGVWIGILVGLTLAAVFFFSRFIRIAKRILA